MSEVIVAKAGGTSNATAEAVQMSLAWAEQSDIFVVSAPGKLDVPGSQKVTDLLLHGRNMYETTGEVPGTTTDAITERFEEIVRGLGSAVLPGIWIDNIRPRVEESARHSKDAASMLGERLQAEIYQALGFRMLDPGRALGNLGSDPDAWRAWLGGNFDERYRYVLPGNTTKWNGHLVTFDRGGSDISGGLAAYGVNADLNLNLTDGQALSADPALIDRKRLSSIGHMPYIVARELGRSGTGLVHAAAMVPLMIGDIPTEVRSTFNRNQPATRLDNDYTRASRLAGQVLALSLMRNMDVLQIHEPGMAEAVGRLAAFDQVLATAAIPLVDSQGAGVDAQRFYVAAAHGNAALEALRSVVRKGGTVHTRENEVDLVTMAGFDLERELLNIQEDMRSIGVLGNEWQQQWHDLSHGNHGIRISVDSGTGGQVLDQLHRRFIENR